MMKLALLQKESGLREIYAKAGKQKAMEVFESQKQFERLQERLGEL
jgi:hypothetical protein